MQRFLPIPLVALGLLACLPSEAEGDVPADSCWEALLTCADTELPEESAADASTTPSVSQATKDAGRWVTERFLRHVRVDPASYPQRPYVAPSS